ncbi:MAG: hypothetical protein P4L33_12785 [Capsulimonadaceae bacterium]|nr:hypothetical protein [Capsulimonadaceae bacterium]
MNDTGSGSMVGADLQPDPSIYNDRGSGMRGLFELTSRLGYKVDVNRDDWRRLPADASLLVVAAPQTRSDSSGGPRSKTSPGVLNGHDAVALKSWLAAGRTALILTNDLPAARAQGQPAANLPGGDFGDEFGVTIGESLAAQGGLASYGPQQPVNIVRGVNLIQLHGGHRIRRIAGSTVDLFGNPPALRRKGPIGGEPVVSVLPVGKGRAIFVADGFFASNRNLARADNAVFLGNILADSVKPGQKALFDEYHHGEIAGEGTIWSALGFGPQSACLQLVLAVIVMVFVLAPRFGTARPAGPNERRNSGEYVASLAALYRGAHAAAPALDFIYRQFLRDLCTRLNVPTDLSLAALAEAAGRRGHVNEVELKKLLGRCERHIETRSLTENELLDLVRQMERFRKELSID